MNVATLFTTRQGIDFKLFQRTVRVPTYAHLLAIDALPTKNRVLILISFALPEAAGTETDCNYPSKTLHRKKGELGAFDTCPEAHGTAKTSG
eukprot:scaffold15909_cov132-Skeletonema_marinoi.AAC.5